jgi:hypothetical protein
MRLGKVRGPEGALKVKGVNSRLMEKFVSRVGKWGRQSDQIQNLMENRQNAYPLGDMPLVTPGEDPGSISRAAMDPGSRPG